MGHGHAVAALRLDEVGVGAGLRATHRLTSWATLGAEATATHLWGRPGLDLVGRAYLEGHW